MMGMSWRVINLYEGGLEIDTDGTTPLLFRENPTMAQVAQLLLTVVGFKVLWWSYTRLALILWAEARWLIDYSYTLSKAVGYCRPIRHIR